MEGPLPLIPQSKSLFYAELALTISPFDSKTLASFIRSTPKPHWRCSSPLPMTECAPTTLIYLSHPIGIPYPLWCRQFIFLR